MVVAVQQGRACGAMWQWHDFVSNVVLKPNLIPSFDITVAEHLKWVLKPHKFCNY